MRRVRHGIVVLAALTMAQAGPAGAQPGAPAKGVKAGVTRSEFGKLPDGQVVELFTLTNSKGVEVRVMSYGATIVSLRVPDRQGRMDDVVLGHDDLDGYLAASRFFGSIVGRYGNRIAKGRFTLGGQTYTLATNNGPNHLHGGRRGFDKVLWKATPLEPRDGIGVVLRYTSADGEEGYPGALSVRVTYTLSEKDELAFDYFATTDKETIVNLTQHSYFNLAGDGKRDVLGQLLQIDADRYTPVDATLIPTGALAPVEGTPFDFRKPTAIGARIEQKDEQLGFGKGYDHNYVLNRKGPGLAKVATLSDPETGRVMEVATTEPGVQFYSGNFLDGTAKGKGGKVYGHRYGLCLETQHYPDSPNQPSFPSTVLRPGQEYRSKTVLTFSVAR
jgi:aldose 1-epimerase